MTNSPCGTWRSHDRRGPLAVAIVIAVAILGAPARGRAQARDAGDQVETIDLGDAPGTDPRSVTPSVTPPPTVPAGADGALEARGWARTRLSIQAARGGARPGEPAAAVLPFDQLVHDDQMFLRMRYTRGHSLEIVTSAYLAWTLFEQAAADGDSFNGFNGTSARGIFEGDLREAYVGVFWRRLDLRIGQQRIAWGKGDAFTPNDVLNPRDLRDPWLTETDVQRLPVLAARADVDLGRASLQIDVVPFFVSNRFDVWGSNWALVQPDAPLPLRVVLDAIESGVDPTVRDLVQPALAQTRRPRYDLTQPAAGARLAFNGEKADAALYYHVGYSPNPYFRVSPDLGPLLAASNPDQPEALLAQVFAAARAGRPLFASTFEPRHHVGADGQIALGPFIGKVDAAFESQAPFVRRDFSALLSPVAEGVAAVEYQPGELGRSIAIEAYYQHVFDAKPGEPLLAAARDTVAAAALVRWTFKEHFEIELRAVEWLEPRGTLVRPQVAYRTGALELRVGATLLEGSEGSYAWYYRRNNGAYTMARYSF
jgi:hypothetical protein